MRNYGLALLVTLLLGGALNAQSATVSGTGGGDFGSTGFPASTSVTFNVSGLSGTQNVSNVSVTISIHHTWLGDVNLTLTDPQANTHAIFTKIGGGSFGDSTNFGDPVTPAHALYTFNDAATGNIWTTAAALGSAVPLTVGSYRTSDAAGTVTTMNLTFGAITANQANGTWTLTFTDTFTGGDPGNVLGTSCSLTVEAIAPTSSEINVYEGVGTGGAQFTNPDSVSGLLIGPAGSGLDYTIENAASATADLVMPTDPVSFTFNSGNTAVSVTITQPSSLTVTAGNNIGFLVTIATINTGGAFDFDLEIASNDPNDDPFVINFTGTAFSNNAARANPETVTSSPVFTGTADSGPFGFAADPGTTVASSLTIDDADADDVLITNITPAGAQAGITAAASAAGPAASLSVNFTGTLDANAAPGVYTWTIDIEDDQVPAGSRTVTVNITLNNVAPVGTNAAIAPTTGTGVDLANAYARTFFETTTVATTNLFDVTDVNLGQTLAILSQTRTGGTGTTFPFDGQFAITGSAGSFTVSVSTTAALIGTDVGTHEYQLVIEDVTGGNQITVFVTLTVSAQTAPTFTGGTAVSIAQGASSTGVVVGDAADAQDPFTALGVAATTVPTGITVSAIAVNGTTGEVTATISVGAAAAVGTNTITFTVTDSLSATGTGTFDVNVTANTIPSITAGSAVSMGTSASVTNRTIATVSDAEDAAGTLTVTVVTAPAGVAVTAITNTTGTVTATITTTAATAGANIVVLQVMDSDGATATANLTVNVSSGGGGGGGGGDDDDGGGCAASGSSSSLWLALFGLMAVAAMALRVRRSRA